MISTFYSGNQQCAGRPVRPGVSRGLGWMCRRLLFPFFFSRGRSLLFNASDRKSSSSLAGPAAPNSSPSARRYTAPNGRPWIMKDAGQIAATHTEGRRRFRLRKKIRVKYYFVFSAARFMHKRAMEVWSWKPVFHLSINNCVGAFKHTLYQGRFQDQRCRGAEHPMPGKFCLTASFNDLDVIQ